MRIVYAAVMMVMLAGPVCAQSQKPVPQYGDDKARTPQEIAAEKESDRAYKKSLGNIPEQKAPDPWGTVRTDNAPKTVAKAPAAKRAKAGGAAN